MNLTFAREFVKKNKFLLKVAVSSRKLCQNIKSYNETKERLSFKDDGNMTIFYLGIPMHANLGDLAQGVCIRRWIKKNYPDARVVEIETNALCNTIFPALKMFKKKYKKGDVIIFQSGYTTTDLGGFADEMHRTIMNLIPDAKMLMMPQTIFFKSEENKRITAEIYNSMKNMLFLARDNVSYDMAKEMFPDIPVKVFPDIVTTLIGTVPYNKDRDGILFCLRNDGEKYYSDDELSDLENKCRSLASVQKTDTTKKGNTKQIVKNAEEFIYGEVEKYSKYRLMITDRYHGTILSLVAGTPVIILKTTDHKVVTGADWFRGVYDDHVYLASTLEEAYEMAEKILQKNICEGLEPVFEKEYYDKLKGLFEAEVGDR